MKTLLVLAKQPAWASALRETLDLDQYQVIHRSEVWEAEHQLRKRLVDCCILDADLADIQPVRIIEQLQHWAPLCPIILYTRDKPWEWEEKAYLAGATHILTQPFRGALLQKLLARILPAAAKSDPAPPPSSPAETQPWVPPPRRPQTLEVLRDLSGILRHSLCTETLLNEFLLSLREILAINRAAVFLRPPSPSLNLAGMTFEHHQFHLACALGLDPSLLENFGLSVDYGIGGHVLRTGRILRNPNDTTGRDREIQKEFEVLGAEVAIPIYDRQTVIGVALLDGRLTGEAFSNEELALIFHLFEQLGLALKNSWFHNQISQNQQMMTGILSQMESGCVLVGANLEILHTNRMARALFANQKPEKTRFEFVDLPRVIASKVFEVLKTGLDMPGFNYSAPETAEPVYQVRITHFRHPDSRSTNAALMIIEDITQRERSRRLELESANLKLVKNMAARLAHEINNALVPLSTHQQLLAKKLWDPEFLESLDEVMAEGIKRVSRLSRQMWYLAQDGLSSNDTFLLAELIQEAFQTARSQFNQGTAHYLFQDGQPAVKLNGSREALKHALAELMLNSFQANPDDPVVEVRFRWHVHPNQEPHCTIALLDKGPGFTEKSWAQAQNPFFTTRAVGLGLGLKVARRIIEAHHGRLQIPPDCCRDDHPNCDLCQPQKGVVCVILPGKKPSGSVQRPVSALDSDSTPPTG